MGISPYAVRRRLSQNFVGGDAHIAPPVGATAFTFQSVSGSGAEGETILNLGHVLPIPYLPTQKEVKKPCGFLRIFGYFLCAQKVPHRRHGHADSTASSQPKHRNPISSHRRKPSRRAEDAGGELSRQNGKKQHKARGWLPRALCFGRDGKENSKLKCAEGLYFFRSLSRRDSTTGSSTGILTLVKPVRPL